jgi:hypothetical protein
MTSHPRFLHVANGTCTTRLIEAAGIPGLRSIWADVLYEGPVPEGIDDAGLVEVRARVLSSPGDRAIADVAAELKHWRIAIERHESYDELVLWFEHDLFDQLNLVQLLSWIRERLPRSKTVSLVCIGSFPGRPGFKGLGELQPNELATLLGVRRPASEAHYALAARAWEAFRASSPEPLDGLRGADTSALPFLAAAVERLLEEYPWTTDGLSRSERRLLQLAGPGPIDLPAAFPRMHDGESAYYITDGSLVELADALARTSPALVTQTPGTRAEGEVLQGSVALTDIGRAVLDGRMDRIAACGIDRWIGGVHLRSGDPVWRWDPRRRRMVLA